jgi:hypothetical protein
MSQTRTTFDSKGAAPGLFERSFKLELEKKERKKKSNRF